MAADAIKAFNTEPYDGTTNPKGIQVKAPFDIGGVVDAAPVGIYAGSTVPASAWTNPTGQGINGSTPVVLYRSGDAQTAGAPTAVSIPSNSNRAGTATPDDVDPLTHITLRIYRVDDPSNNKKGWLPDFRYLRLAGDNDTVNPNGGTLVSQDNFVDPRYFVFRKKNRSTNAVIQYIPATISAISQSPLPGNRAPDYIDLQFDLHPLNVSGGVVAAPSSTNPIVLESGKWFGDDGQLERGSEFKYEAFIETNLPARYYGIPGLDEDIDDNFAG